MRPACRHELARERHARELPEAKPNRLDRLLRQQCAVLWRLRCDRRSGRVRSELARCARVVPADQHAMEVVRRADWRGDAVGIRLELVQFAPDEDVLDLRSERLVDGVVRCRRVHDRDPVLDACSFRSDDQVLALFDLALDGGRPAVRPQRREQLALGVAPKDGQPRFPPGVHATAPTSRSAASADS